MYLEFPAIINSDFAVQHKFTLYSLALGPNNHLVVTQQNAFENVPNRRENFGPAFERKWGQPWPVGGHDNHLHFSVDGN